MLEENKNENEDTTKTWLLIFDCVGGSNVVFGGGVFVHSVELARLSDNWDVRTQRELT